MILHVLDDRDIIPYKQHLANLKKMGQE